MTGASAASPAVRVALVWEQFAPYHGDRCEAVAQRLGTRARVTAVELASASHRYAWAPIGDLAGVARRTLFPGVAEAIGRRARHRALLDALRGQDLVVLGLASSDPSIALLAWRLRRSGARVLFCSDSKADDYPRRALGELVKRALLRAYDGGIVAGPRSAAYYRGLGVARLWPGYDTLSVARLRRLASASGDTGFTRRPFLFLGRFVPKKAIDLLLDAYATYRRRAAVPRDLVIAGSGPLQDTLQARARALGIAGHVAWPGFLGPEDSARAMAGALALVLPSVEEQWGLVVNEAVALGLPVIASEQVGACDLLVRSNGIVVPTGDSGALAEALLQMAGDETAWQAMREASEPLAWYADSARFADAIEDVVFPGAATTAAAVARLRTG